MGAAGATERPRADLREEAGVPFFVSPSKLARFFYHDCERQLKAALGAPEQLKAWGVSTSVTDTNPVTALLQDSGYNWEEQVVGQILAGKARIAAGEGALSRRVFTAAQTLEQLASLAEGEWLYQPTLQPGPGFNLRYQLDPELVRFADCRPDLLRVREGKLQVIDVKASDALKASHRVQVAFYALLLEEALRGAGSPLTIDREHGFIWLYNKAEPSPFPLAPSIAILEGFLRDIADNLRGLAGDDFRKIEVTNLNSWAARFMGSQGRKMRVASDAQRDQAWNEAIHDNGLELDKAFYTDEWSKVVQAQDVLDQAQYFKARRVGRGTGLSRQQRAMVWKVFERYRGELERLGVVEYEDVIREARLLLEKSPGLGQYDAVLADEVQDFRAADLKLLRALAKPGPNDLFLVGDPHQRIYGHVASLGACGIEVRGRSRRLKINYRTTQRIGDLATRILTGLVVDDLDDGQDNLKGYHSLRQGEPPLVESFEKQKDEEKFVVSTVKSWLSAPGVRPRDICLAARRRSSLDKRFVPLLEGAGIKAVMVNADTPESSLDPEAVRVATMHRLKGLEFPRVILVDLDDVPYQHTHDEAASQDAFIGERCLRYVAMTRARDHLAVVNCSDKKWFA